MRERLPARAIFNAIARKANKEPHAHDLSDNQKRAIEYACPATQNDSRAHKAKACNSVEQSPSTNLKRVAIAAFATFPHTPPTL